MYNISEKYHNLDEVSSIKKDIYGSLYKHDSVINKFHKYEKKINKELKSLNNNNKMLFRMAKKTSSCQDMHNHKSSRDPDILYPVKEVKIP